MSTGVAGQTHVLVVEDSRTQAEATRFALQRAGFKTTVARNGRDAMDRLLSGCAPDLIVSDIVMPDMDGYRFCRTVKRSGRHRHIPLILLTALNDPDDVIQGLQCGADGFLTKPIEPEFLADTVNDFLQRVSPEAGAMKTYDARLLILDTRGSPARRWYEAAVAGGFQVAYRNVDEEWQAGDALPGADLVITSSEILAAPAAVVDDALSGDDTGVTPAVMVISESGGACAAFSQRFPNAVVYECKPDVQEIRKQIDAILEIDRRDCGSVRGHVRLRFQGQERVLRIDVRQMLSLLMSTYGNAVRQNKKLIDTQARLEQLNTSLETAVRDRTDQLVRAERGYRRFLENTHSGFYRVNAGGKIVEANSALVNMLGYGSRQELYELESAESMYRGGPAMARILRDGRPNGAFPTHKSVLLTRNGEEIHVLENIFVQTDRAGQVEYVDGLVDDITQIEAYGERMTTLSHLVRIANSRLDFESILGALSTHLGETFPAAYICACIRDEDAGTFHVVTPQGVSTSAEGLDGANPLSTKQLHECLATGRTIYSASIGGPRGDGGTPGDGEILSAVMVPISASEKAIGVLVVGRDREAAISADDIRFLENVAGHLGIAIHNSRLYGELKDAYQLLQETQGQIIQQERMRAIGEMASGIAHDFNNSLTSVLGFTELILNDEHVRRDEARVCEFLGHVRDAALDGQEIVGRLREFYRTREHDETFEAVDLNEVVEKAISLTRPKWFNQAQERGVPIEIDRELDPECTVSGSFTSIREVLTNLIFNSVDAVSEHYTASRPDPAYRPRIRIQTRSDGERVYLVVSDNGPGMSEDVKKRCFEPFFTTKGEHGSGLGLGMVYGIVQRLEGSIEIESEPGSGTAMTISLPAAGTCRKTERETEVDAGALRGVRVLAVDDNPKVCLMLSNMLQGAGMRVDVAGSGADALELFREHRHDLVITDKGMIGMRGDELAAEIKRIDPATPVAMMTGYGALMLAQGEKPEHVDLVLTKPVQQQQLIGAIHALVSAAAATG